VSSLETEVTNMRSPMDDERALARIEQRLASDDPALARRIEALNTQVTELASDGRRPDFRVDGRPVTGHAHENQVTGQVRGGGEERSWTVKVAVVFAVLAAVGLLLTAILSAPGSGGEGRPPQPYGLDTPVSSRVLEGQPGQGMP
jgi:hypothetical protein